MRGIFKWFIVHPKLVNLILVGVLFMGMLSFINIKRDSLPHVDFKMVFVTTIYPGAAPEDVEVNITIPIEEELQNVSGIKQLNSYSSENFSNIFIEIDPNAKDIEKVKSDISKAVDRVSGLPAEILSKPVLTELKSDIFPVFEIAISGNIPESELRDHARFIEKRLKLLQGVGGTAKSGYRKREVHINVDLNKTEQNYISLAEIMAAVRSANIRLSAGDIQTATSRKKIVTLSQFEEPLDVKDVIVRSVFSGKRLLVSDVATVADDFEKLSIINKTNGEYAINIVINKKEDADAVRVGSSVKELLAEIQLELPRGVKAQVVRDFSKYVNRMLSTVTTNATIGFIFVLICLVIFLNPRVAFWTSLGIPFSLMLTFYFMPVYDIAITSISLLAIIIVLGMLVDDAIVIAEHIYTFREQGMDPIEASIKGVSAIFWPVVATVATTIAAFLPILLMGGIFGEWLRAIPIVVTVVLLASLFESAFILPCHLAHTKFAIKEKPKLLQRMEAWYKEKLLVILKNKYRFIGFFVGLFIFAVAVVMPIVGFELMPMGDQDIILIKMETPKGTNFEETEKRVRKVEEMIKDTVPKEIVASYVTTIGQKGVDMWDSVTGVTRSNWARVIIYLTPQQDRKISSMKAAAMIKPKLKGLKGKGFTQVDVVERAGGPPTGQAIDVTFIGNDDKIRQLLADKFYDFITANEAVFDVTRDDEKTLNQVNIRINEKLMSELGITATDVAGVIRAAVDGNVVTSIRKSGEEIDYRVMVLDKFKKDSKYIKNLTIPNRLGKLIRLGSFIRFEEEDLPEAIPHLEGDRAVRIRGEVDTKKLNAGKYNALLKKEFIPMAAMYPGFRVKFGGLEQSTAESMSDFYRSLLVALIAIYIILVVLFNSFTQPVIVMLAIPFGLVGVIFAFALHMTTLSFLGLIGILGLSGVVVNNSLVMLKFLNEKQKAECGDDAFLANEQVIDAAVRRFRPVVLTTITTVAGLLPSLYGFIGGKLDQLFPLLLAIAWGLVFATFITLFLIPSIYLAEKDFSCWLKKKINMGMSHVNNVGSNFVENFKNNRK
ncbi:efflux RND transporter permease subunit [Candidatus Margulisiibacteriota bacterium]